MTPAIKPWLLHSSGEYTDGLKTELALLRSGELRCGVSRNYDYMSRWTDPRGRASPVFLRLGAPPDISNMETLGENVVLALDARVLRSCAFQLNQGWWPEQRGRESVRGERPGESVYPWKVRGAVLDGREMDDAAVFAHLKKLDTARRRLFSLNGPFAKARRGCWMMSNEILVDSPVSLAESLRIVFVPDSIPTADAAKLCALVAKRYPLARVEEYIYER